MVAHLRQDLSYTLRTLRRHSGFTTFAVLIAGLGIGACVTVFSVVNTLLLQPLPFEKPSELVWIANRDVPDLSGQTTQVGYLQDLQQRSQTLSAIAGYFAFYGNGDHVLTGAGEPERLTGVPVSHNFFELLGVTPIAGRTFTHEESVWNGPRVVMLGHTIWERRFDRDSGIIGRSLTINDTPHTVVGVLPPSFDFGTVFAPGSRFDLFFPFPLSPETNRWGNTMAMIGRLNAGVTAEAAAAEVRVLAAQLNREHPDRNGFEGVVRPLAEQVSGQVAPAVIVLAGAVGMVMLIVCANLSNLLLARTAARQKEVAVRMALGADRRRLVTQMLTEALVLSSAGCVLGLALAVVGIRLLTQLEGVDIPLLRDVHPDTFVVTFAVTLTALTGIAVGLAPALQASAGSMAGALKDATRGSTEGRERSLLRNGLMVAEIAFACVLLVGAGLLIRSLVQVLHVDMGFDPRYTSALRVDPDSRLTTAAERIAHMDEVLRRAQEAPGFERAAVTDTLPFGRNRTWGAGAKGQTYDRGTYPMAFVRIVSEGYPEAMGIPVVAGRDLAASDTADSAPVMLVNKTLADTLWPDTDAIGQYIVGPCAEERRVVGVVGDVRHLSLELPAGNEMYIPARQCDDLAGATLVVRSRLPPARVASTLRTVLSPVSPNLAGNDFHTLQDLVDRSVSPRRFTVVLLVGFAGFALVLASLGIYALISYSVNQRTQEIGIRMALGASPRDVQNGIIGQTFRLVAVGLSAGAMASWMLARGLAGLLYGVTAGDPRTFGMMAVVLIGVAAAAGYLPARRASRLDPMKALRSE